MGYALFVAQSGGRHRRTKTFTGMGGAGVVADHRGDATPRMEIRVIEQRLREAERLHKENET